MSVLELEERGPVPVLVHRGWRARWPELVVAFSTRRGGVSGGPYASLNLSLATRDDPERVVANRRALFGTLGLPPGSVYGARQVHGAAVRRVAGPAPAVGWPPRAVHDLGEGDVLVAERPGAFLFATFADCVPVVLVDPSRRAAALAHAGWRGTAAGAAAAAVEALRAGGSQPGDLYALIGPCIGPCCYEVDEPVASALAPRLADAGAALRLAGPGRYRLDLAEANRQQLVAAGVDPGRIDRAGICTGCRRDLLYSHRVEGPTGRFGAVVGWRQAGVEANGAGGAP